MFNALKGAGSATNTIAQPPVAAPNSGVLSGLGGKLEGFRDGIMGTPDSRNPFSQTLQDISGGSLGKYRSEMNDTEKRRQDLLAQLGQPQSRPQFSPVQMMGGQQGNPLSAYLAQIMSKGGQI